MASIYDSLVHQKITVYRPGELEYERSVATSNLLYRFSRPHYVVQPAHASEVQVIVQEAQADGMKITIKGGGHSYAGFSTAKRGILLDLVKMNDVHLDIEKGTVTVQGGAQWGHVYKKLINGRHDQFVVNGGRCPTVGVGGFTLGGGLGPFTRSFGLGCDTVESATIVDANGRLITATKDQNPDLFWALRGAGGGNFGVFVKMKMRVQKLHSKSVVAGKWVWYPTLSPKPKPAETKGSEANPVSSEQLMAKFTTAMNGFYQANWSNEMTIDSSWLCDLEKTNTETPIGVRFLVYYNGNKADFEKEILAKVGEKSSPEVQTTEEKEISLAGGLIERSLQEPSTLFFHETLVAQWSEEIQKSFPTNKKFDVHTSFCFDETADFPAVTEIIKAKFAEFRKVFVGEKGLLQVTFIHAGGKGTKPDVATSFYWRGARYYTYIMLEWEEKFLSHRMETFLADFETLLRPKSMGGIAKYVNFADARLRNPKKGKPENGLPLPGESYYGDHLERLQKIKADVDKDNFFRWRQGIQPEGAKVPENAAVITGEIQSLTDLAAGKEWSGLGDDVTNLTNIESAGGVFALTDLGF